MDDFMSFFSDNSEVIIPVTMFLSVVVIGVIANYYSKRNRLIRRFKQAKRRTPGSIRTTEYVKLVGAASATTTPLKALLSGRECVYYQARVYLKRGKNWETIINETKRQDFFIETNTEKVLVNLSLTPQKETLCYLVKDYKESSQNGQAISPALESFIKAHNIKRYGAFGVKPKLKCVEGVIEVNERIAVMGLAKWETPEQPIDGYSYSKLLALSGSKKEKLLITDEPKALKRVNDRL